MQTYCERCGPGLFDEPINASSNLVFLLAACVILAFAVRRRALTPGLGVLIGLAVSVGVGSALWHTFATPWAFVLDVVPIMLFQFAFLWLYGRQVAGLPAAVVVALLVAYIAAGWWMLQYRDWLNGAMIYAPTVVLSWAVGVHWWRTGREERPLLLISAGVFCLALLCRSIDLLVCRQLPFGTHFLWHVLNGGVLFAAMRVLILAHPAGPSTSAESPAGFAPAG